MEGLVTGGRGGVSVVELNLSSMWDIVQQTKIGDGGVAYVVNADGRVIAHPDFDVRKSLRDLSSLAQVQEARTTAGSRDGKTSSVRGDYQVGTKQG
jgi:hypothetical protein